MRYRKSFPWLPLLVGILLGIAGGLYYAWVVNPVNFVDIAPNRLNDDDKAVYILLVGEAYLSDGNLARARARLDLLGERDIAKVVSIQADSAFLRGAGPQEVRALVALAEALGVPPLAADIFSGTVAVLPTRTGPPTPTFEAMASPTPAPSPVLPSTPAAAPPTPTAVLVASQYDLISLNASCPDQGPRGLIEIYVGDGFGNGIPAIEVLVEWEEGRDVFFTGLKPQINPGYADFQMEPDRRYSVTLFGLSEPVLGIESTTCQTDTGQFVLPSYQLIFAPAAEDS